MGGLGSGDAQQFISSAFCYLPTYIRHFGSVQGPHLVATSISILSFRFVVSILGPPLKTDLASRTLFIRPGSVDYSVLQSNMG